MGRNLSESSSTNASQALVAEEHAALSAAHALLSEKKAKEYADIAQLASGSSSGTNTAIVYIYQRLPINIPPTLPSQDTTYYISSGEVEYLDNGWSNKFPATGGDYLFVSYAIITSPGGLLITTISPDKWLEAQLMAQSTSGESSTAFWMTRSSGVIKKDSTNAYTPSIITFSGHFITGTGPVTDYPGRFIVAITYDGTNFQTNYISEGDEHSIDYTIPPDIKAVRTRMYQTGGTSVLLQEELVPVVIDGVNFTVKVESTNGDIFRLGQSTTTLLIAHVFKNGVEITDSLSPSNFRWRRVSVVPKPPPNDDASWNLSYASGFKTVQVSIDNVDSKATFHCDLFRDD